MTWSHEVTINGYVISFLVGSPYGGDGVVFDPDSADWDDLAFIDALKYGAEMYPYMKAYGRLGHYIGIEDYLADAPSFIFDGLRDDYQTLEEGVALGVLAERYKDNLRIVNDVLMGLYVRPKRDQTPSKAKAKPGYVYILKAETGHYKIGRAVNPANRLETFTVKLPFKVEYELVIKSDDYHQLERNLHARFTDCRLDGEWFALTSDDIEAIRKEFAA